jgi:cytochrome c biogenesis protein CcdA
MTFFRNPMSPRDEAQWLKFRRHGALVFIAGFTTVYMAVGCLVTALLSLRLGQAAFSLLESLGGFLISGLTVSSLTWLSMERRFKATIKTRQIQSQTTKTAHQ